MNVFQKTALNEWYTVALSVDPRGVGTVRITDSHGVVLATKGDLPVGLGPFFVILGQREGAPFTVGANEAVWASVEVSAAPSPAPTALTTPSSPAVTSEAQCTGAGEPGVSNGTHGTIHILSGTGIFSQVSPSNKRVVVPLGGSIDGTLSLQAVNHGPGFAVAPLIWTPSWGDLSNSWQVVSPWVRPGLTTLKTRISKIAPQSVGTYYIIFAFSMETNGASVASATNWALGQPVWGDGNDIGQFSSKQVNEAQTYGCTINNGLSEKGFQLLFLPADAITVEVGAAQTLPSSDSKANESGKGDIRTADFRNFQYQPNCLDKEAIHVANGEWKATKGDETDYFRVISVTFGDLIGDGHEDAVVLGACGGVANFEIGDILLFSMEAGSPHQFAELFPTDWGRGQQENGGDFQVSEIRVRNQHLAISFYAGGSHASPAWVVTATFHWSGSRFERVGMDRKPFTGWPRR